MDRIQVRGMHVDFQKRSVDRRTDTRQGTGRVAEETHHAHYARHNLGLCRYVRRSRMGVVKDDYPAGGGFCQHGTGFQNRCPVCCTMEPFVVLSAHELESWEVI